MNGTAIGCLGSTRRRFARNNPKLTLPFDAISSEICLIDRKNEGKGFALGQIHERRVGEIHGPIPIARHQRLEMTHFFIFNCGDNQRSRTDKLPGGFHRPASITNQVENLCEHRLRRK